MKPKLVLRHEFPDDWMIVTQLRSDTLTTNTGIIYNRQLPQYIAYHKVDGVWNHAITMNFENNIIPVIDTPGKTVPLISYVPHAFPADFMAQTTETGRRIASRIFMSTTAAASFL